MGNLGRLLLFLGGGLFFLGLLFIALGKVPGFGHLPGDIVIQRGNFTLYMPLVTMLLVSLFLTIVINLILRFFRG